MRTTGRFCTCAIDQFLQVRASRHDTRGKGRDKGRGRRRSDGATEGHPINKESSRRGRGAFLLFRGLYLEPRPKTASGDFVATVTTDASDPGATTARRVTTLLLLRSLLRRLLGCLLRGLLSGFLCHGACHLLSMNKCKCRKFTSQGIFSLCFHFRQTSSRTCGISTSHPDDCLLIGALIRVAGRLLHRAEAPFARLAERRRPNRESLAGPCACAGISGKCGGLGNCPPSSTRRWPCERSLS
jgi:hypothetical protein